VIKDDRAVSSMLRNPLARERGSIAGPMPSSETIDSSMSSTAAGVRPSRQGLAFAYLSAQLKHFLWDTLGRWMGHNS